MRINRLIYKLDEDERHECYERAMSRLSARERGEIWTMAVTVMDELDVTIVQAYDTLRELGVAFAE